MHSLKRVNERCIFNSKITKTYITINQSQIRGISHATDAQVDYNGLKFSNPSITYNITWPLRDYGYKMLQLFVKGYLQ